MPEWSCGFSAQSRGSAASLVSAPLGIFSLDKKNGGSAGNTKDRLDDREMAENRRNG